MSERLSKSVCVAALVLAPSMGVAQSLLHDGLGGIRGFLFRSPNVTASKQSAPTTGATTSTSGGTTTSGTNSSGTSSPSSPTSSTPPPAPAAPATPPPLPWRGTAFIWDHSVSTETVAPASQLSPLPSYQWWFSIRPRFALAKGLSLRLRQDMTVEWFNTASTQRIRDAQLGDLWTDLVYSPPQVAGFGFSFGLRFLWPISLRSRTLGNYFTLGLTAGVNKNISLGNAGDLSLSIGLAGSHPFAATTQATAAAGVTWNCSDLGWAASTCDTDGSSRAIAFQLVHSYNVSWSKGPVSLLLSYTLINQWVSPLPDVTIGNNINGPEVVIGHAADDNRMRQSSWFLANVDFELSKWLSLSLGYYTFRPILDPGGNYGNPFWSPGGNSRIYTTFTFAIDEIYNAIAGRNPKGNTGGGNTRSITRNENRSPIASSF